MESGDVKDVAAALYSAQDPESGALVLDSALIEAVPAADRPAVWTRVARTLLDDAQDLPKARMALGQALAIDPNSNDASRTIGEIPDNVPLGDEVIEVYEDLLATAPDNTTLRAELVILLLQDERTDFAAQVLEIVDSRDGIPDSTLRRLERELAVSGLDWQPEVAPGSPKLIDKNGSSERYPKRWVATWILAMLPGHGLAHFYAGARLRAVFLALEDTTATFAD